MKRLGFLLAVLVLVAAGAALTTAVAGTHAASKAICHRTSSATKPYAKLSVPAKALAVHLKHPADIYPVPKSGCPKTLLATTGGTAFDVTLVGNSESRPATGGERHGDRPPAPWSGTGLLQACGEEPAGRRGGAHPQRCGGVVRPGRDPARSLPRQTAPRPAAPTTRSLVAAILKNPAGYHVNVHTAEFPGGAIRGQLTGTSAADVGTVYSITLNGSTEPNATGTAVVRIIKDTNLVCYRLHAANVTLPTVAAHIHRGGASVNGPVVVPFTPPGANGDSSGCATSTPDLINEITGSPSGFYVNVHTREHPGGAMRNQLG